MKKLIVAFVALFLFCNLSKAQNDTMYIMKNGVAVGKYNVNTQVDSVIFYQPNINSLIIESVNIPSGTFTMGSPVGEPYRLTGETQHQVTLSAFRMSKYEITNSQYATFLNAKKIGNEGKYSAGIYPTKKLISACGSTWNWGLIYNNQWIPVPGFENHPVVGVSWYGAAEFASFVGATLPTEAQWEYACRAGTNTTFNTGICIDDLQANYDWSCPQSGCINSKSIRINKTQTVGSYSANAWGLYDMHGNVLEWCIDWYGDYLTTPQTNPTGSATGTTRVRRGGSWTMCAYTCRSAVRPRDLPEYSADDVGFRVVFQP